MKEPLRIGLIGGGNMGEVMVAAMLEKGLTVPEAIRLSDKEESRRVVLKSRYHITAVESNPEALPGSDIIILAVKPQNLATVAVELNSQLHPEQLLLSIVAGATIATLAAGFNHQRVVRVMPNTPARVGRGMSVWAASPEVSQEQREQARLILDGMGKQIYVDDEDIIDKATAVSGSGPAYVFFFMELLIEAAKKIGLPEEMAQELVVQTVHGSVCYAEQSGKPLDELRRMVTSPGGTTAEALAQFEKGDFAGLIARAVSAAYQKARRLAT